MSETLQAGAATVEITPQSPQHLYGYPYLTRYHTGVHDPLWSSALYLSDGATQLLFIANDVIFIPKDSAARIRERLAGLTSVPASNIMVSATHTHSGPTTVDYLSNEHDKTVPPRDERYIKFLEERIIEAGEAACQRAQAAQTGLALADATGVGTNRRSPDGPADTQVPVLVARSRDGRTNIAAMIVCSMHPTVMHEDSSLVSGDFPGMARQYVQSNALGEGCPLLYHTGPAGNQSPRHVIDANTFDEAERLGHQLGRAVEEAIAGVSFSDNVKLACKRAFVELPLRTFPAPEEAEAAFKTAIERLENLRKHNAPRSEIRTAECDWFGAEERLTLARAAHEGRLAAVRETCMPAEIQVMSIGPWAFVGWPGEIFVEYALAVKARRKDTFVVSLANGELQGYIVTPEAAAEGGYESSNAIFAPESGALLVRNTLELLEQTG